MTEKPTAIDTAALAYHKLDPPGKLGIKATKPLASQRDLALAYSPGVAAPCLAIAADPLAALDYTSRGNLVAVISNGTAVLGLGAIGPLASKPVMEGKAILFKKFAEGGLQRRHNVDETIDVGLVHLDIDAVHVGELFEENRLSFHHRLGGEGA
ncbi:MAG: hypothetical protein AAF615_01725, partial [Pseudomonadota bacterium]